MFALRRYEDADSPTVWRLHVEGLEQVDARAGIPRDEDLSAISATYLDNGGEFLVGAADGAVVAMGALARVSDTVGEIRRVRVDIRYQRRGFGRALLEALERRAVELGYSTVRLDTTTTMTAAHRLYESAGYSEVDRGRYPSGQTKIILQKQLAGLSS